MAPKASTLRANLYRILDRVLETGVPVEIEHRGQRMRVVVVEGRGKLDHLTPHPTYLVGNPDDIVHLDGSESWHGEDPLDLP